MSRPKKLHNCRITVRYPHIYLVALGSSSGAEFRVTERNGTRKPGVVRFSGRRPDLHGNPMGTLVLDEEKFNTWFDGQTLLPNMKTAEAAAKWMVSNTEDVYFGCPICLFTTKNWDEYQAHVANKGNWILEQFELEVEEVENGNKD